MNPSRPQRKLHPHVGVAMYAVVTLFLGAAAFNSQTNLLFWAFGLMLGGLIVTVAVGALMLGGVRVRRLTPHHGAVGEPLRVRYKLTNRRAVLPCFAMIVSEREGAAGGALAAPPRGWVLHVPPGGSTQAEAIAWPKRRGVIRFGRIRLETTFPFGVLRQSITHTQPGRVVIYPQLYRLRRELLREVRLTSPTGSRPSRRSGGRDEFFGLREYRPSDSMKMIDWKHSARLGKLVSREMTHQTPPRLMVLLDLRGRSISDDDRAAERAISFAASVLCAASGEGFEVGLAVSGAACPAFEPHTGRWHRTRLLSALGELDLAHAEPGKVSGAAGRDAHWLVLHAGPIDAGHGPAGALHFSDADFDAWRAGGGEMKPTPPDPTPAPAPAAKMGAA